MLIYTIVNQRNSKKIPKIWRQRKTANLAQTSGLVFTYIRVNEHFLFLQINTLARDIAKLMQTVQHNLHIPLRSLPKKHEVICEEQMG